MFVFLPLIGLFLLLFYYFYYTYNTDVKIGQPPIEDLTIAYKYQYLGKSTRSFYNTLSNLFPENRIIKLCYSGLHNSKVEFALGLIVDNENWETNQKLLKQFIDLRLICFKTPVITNALYSEYFIIPWLPFTKWIAVAMAYWKHCRFSEDNNLCGYPVVEIYSDYKVSVVVPLLRQDDFVVEEAERIVYGRKTSAMLTSVIKPLLTQVEYPVKSKLSRTPRDTKG